MPDARPPTEMLMIASGSADNDVFPVERLLDQVSLFMLNFHVISVTLVLSVFVVCFQTIGVVDTYIGKTPEKLNPSFG